MATVTGYTKDQIDLMLADYAAKVHTHSANDIVGGSIAVSVLPQATDAERGAIEIATVAETQAGLDDLRAVTPAKLKVIADGKSNVGHVHDGSDIATGQVNAARLPVSSATASGIVELATTAEATTGTDTARAVTPAGLKAVADTKAALAHTHPASDIASGVLAPARLGTGSPSAATVLLGSGAWGAVPNGSIVGSGSPEGAVAAAPGILYSDSAATNGATLWVKATGTGNTGWKVVYGDTGRRKVADYTVSPAAFASARNVTAGAVYVRRINEMLHWEVVGLKYTSPGDLLAAALGAGFFAAELDDRNRPFNAGQVYYAGVADGTTANYASGVVLTAAAWPTGALPGTAA